jgi:molybdopterin synthase catalytic subunit
MIVALTRQPIDPVRCSAVLNHPACGAVVTFMGTVRNEHGGKKVVRLDYSAYEEMAIRLLEDLAGQAAERFRLAEVVLVHRVGQLAVGDASIFIGAAAPHRKEAFAACQYLIDQVKEIVPVWKKEYYEDGQSWIEGNDSPAPGPGGGGDCQ